MIKYRHGHNDYWNRPQIYKSIITGCDIIEVDVICKDGDVLMSHSWRPWKWLTYGNIESYFMFMKNYAGKKLYFYIEVKTSDYRIVAPLAALIRKYENDNVIILINGIEKWFSSDRYRVARAIYNSSSDVKWFPEWRVGKDIKRLQFYKEQPFYKRLNHW